MINAYKLAEELKQIEELLEETEGEAPDVVLCRLNFIYEQREERLKALHSLLKRSEAQLSLLAEEAKKLKEEKAKIERKYDAIVSQIELLLPRAESWQDGLNALSWKKSQGIEIADGTTLDPVYIRVKEVREPDKVKLTNDIKSGATLPGVTLADRYSIKIK